MEEKVKLGQNKLVKLVGEKGKYSTEVAHLQIDLALTLAYRCMAVKKVVTNSGGRTPGIDGNLLDTPTKRSEMVEKLKEILTSVEKNNKYKCLPVKRVMIPKANGKMRPLGIPTLEDRSLQQLLNLVLLPIVEMYSDPNSYGFRPYRGAKNAVAAVRTMVQSG
jgi:RNA-directed DNA polymerase